jgi:hypothetical protein
MFLISFSAFARLTLKGGLVGLKKVSSQHAATHNDQVGEQPCEWCADGTATHAGAPATAHGAQRKAFHAVEESVAPVGRPHAHACLRRSEERV